MTYKFVFLSNLLMLFLSSGDLKRGQQPGSTVQVGSVRKTQYKYHRVLQMSVKHTAGWETPVRIVILKHSDAL